MGSSGGYGHLNGVHKDILGLARGRAAQVVSTNGSYTLNPYEDGANNVKVLKVPRTRDGSGNVNGYYYLEYRKPTVELEQLHSPAVRTTATACWSTPPASTPLCTAVCSPDFSGSGGGGDSNIVDTQPGSISRHQRLQRRAAGPEPVVRRQRRRGHDAGHGDGGEQRDRLAHVRHAAALDPRRSSTRRTPGSVLGRRHLRTGSDRDADRVTARLLRELAREPLQPVVLRTRTPSRSLPIGTLEAVFTTASCAAAPANDNFPGPTVSTGQQTVDTGSATVQTGEPTT